MKTNRQHIKLVIIGFILWAGSGCNFSGTKTEKHATKSDPVSHGYNELANPENRQHFSISDYNEDNPDIQNINRPTTSSIKTNIDKSLLFGVWTSDIEGPHADFELTKKSFQMVDYDGDGDMPYELNGNHLKIYFNDFIQEGQIMAVQKDTLKIQWKGFDFVNSFVRWPEEE